MLSFKAMNKKSAFIAGRESRENMVMRGVNSAISVRHVVSNFLLMNDSLLLFYGRSTPLGNKHTNSWPLNITVL